MNGLSELEKELNELLNPPQTKFDQMVGKCLLWYGALFYRQDDDIFDQILLGQAGIHLTGTLAIGAVAVAMLQFAPA